MSKPRVIVAAVDLHKGSTLVMDRALELAGGAAGCVHVISVSEPNIANLRPPGDLDAPELTGINRAALNQLIAERSAALEGYELPPVQVHTDQGDPAQKIVDFAAKVSADKIVLATHGRTGLRRLVIGSVAEKVARLAGCTVVVVREKTH